ncbi:Peptidoglycan/LPS O-acetylase OafA/YrhL, contains acyltransferase and SGNH-hydrolase domains [Polaromonas sp. YR568]|uniref:acyltransferase family protein n=1 Tax=Polaromonas sp. YR568 TaxID=1855301 RepID=UPI0008E91B78|nr:acyltransferase [Polaromonas sp. YR568]SFU95568.1 Peptidoglycan/LPS O-acetylase OafA/YrhL, contains acyltransferase and SGNH-hydrolase domains [Polaromonas sp. YR568]
MKGATQQFTGVQILRFAAAMLVVVMHITQAISMHISGTGPSHYWANGSAGVDIFFVISGFVMAMSTASLPLGGPARPSLLNAAWVFMRRRLIRIAPLYWFYTLLKVALLLAMPALAARSSVEPGHLAASLLFIPAMSPWGLVQPTLPVGWTLNFEMLFYAVFAVAIALGAPRIRFCLAAFALVFLGSFLFPDPVALNFYAQTIVFEFILGVCIAHAFLRYRHASPLVGLAVMAAGAIFMFAPDWGHTADRFATWGCGAALVVLGAVWMEPWTLRAPLASRLSFLGDASYSIYLSHTFVVPAGVMALKRLGVQDSLAIVLAVGLAVVVAGCLSYVWLERPMTTFFKRAFSGAPKLSYQNPGK